MSRHRIISLQTSTLSKKDYFDTRGRTPRQMKNGFSSEMVGLNLSKDIFTRQAFLKYLDDLLVVKSRMFRKR